MKIIPFIYNDIDDLCANTYLIVDSSNNALVVDPSKDNDNLINYIEKNNYNLKAILLTHAHFDHIRGLSRLVNHFHCPTYLGFEEKETLTNPFYNCSILMGEEGVVDIKEIKLLADKEIIDELENEIVAIATPYHTKGSICYYIPKDSILISGDFLFKSSIGRADLPTASRKDFQSSISKIITLPDETKVYPGHGGFTTINEERTSNPFLK